MFSYAVLEGRHGGFGIVTDRYVLAVGEHFPLSKVIGLWETLSLEDTTIEDGLSLLAKSGVANLPDFAFVELVDASTGSVTVAVRGEGTVQVGGANPRTFSGTGAVTWIEASAQRIHQLVMSVGAPDAKGMRLPFKRGVVRTDHIYWGVPIRVESDDERSPTSDPSTLPVDDRTLLSSYRTQKKDSPPGTAAAPTAAEAPTDDATLLSRRGAATKSVWKLKFDSGSTIRMDSDVTIGRAPKQSVGSQGRLERLSSPTREISGTHARLSPVRAANTGDEGSTRNEGNVGVLTLLDLHSTNGTVVTPKSGTPVLIREGRSMELNVGDRVDFGDGNIATVEYGSE